MAFLYCKDGKYYRLYILTHFRGVMNLDSKSIFLLYYLMQSKLLGRNSFGMKGKQLGCRKGWVGWKDSLGFRVWVSRIIAPGKS